MTENADQRSRVMRAVKSVDTKPEMVVRRLTHNLGYRYRLHRADLPGKPDLVFLSRRKVIFVHGCFWHGHDCARGARSPVNNSDYWKQKIDRNRARDREALSKLAAANWQALVIWECQIRDRAALADKITAFLT